MALIRTRQFLFGSLMHFTEMRLSTLSMEVTVSRHFSHHGKPPEGDFQSITPFSVNAHFHLADHMAHHL